MKENYIKTLVTREIEEIRCYISILRHKYIVIEKKKNVIKKKKKLFNIRGKIGFFFDRSEKSLNLDEFKLFIHISIKYSKLELNGQILINSA